MGEEKAECLAGEIQSSPTLTPRVSAISGVTFAPGKTPPWPGFAPWDNLISTILIWGLETCSTNLSMEKVPSGFRQPKYPEPISQIMSPPCSRWYEEIEPSPVSCAKPPNFAPLFKARMAFGDKEPKLIAEILKMEAK